MEMETFDAETEVPFFAGRDRAEAPTRTRSARLEAEPPAQVGGYELLEELGRGGMGAVYLGRNRRGERAAVKLLRHEQASPETVARFRLEAEAMQRLRHEGIVSVLDYGVHSSGPFLILELVEGEDLRQRLLREGRLAARDAAQLARDLAWALAHAHRQGVLHRDLKPHNVLVDEGGKPRLIDFGLAKLCDLSRSAVTVTGQVVGTPAYFSPEQARGEGADERSDVYGLGATLYHMLTGTVPFGEVESLTALLIAIAQDEPEPPSRRVPGLPAALEAICLRCLAKDPAGRYPSAAALATDLEAYLEGERPRAQERDLRRELSRRASVGLRWARSPRGALAGLLVLGLGAGALALRGLGELRAASAHDTRAALSAQAAAEERLGDLRRRLAAESQANLAGVRRERSLAARLRELELRFDAERAAGEELSAALGRARDELQAARREAQVSATQARAQLAAVQAEARQARSAAARAEQTAAAELAAERLLRQRAEREARSARAAARRAGPPRGEEPPPEKEASGPTRRNPRALPTPAAGAEGEGDPNGAEDQTAGAPPPPPANEGGGGGGAAPGGAAPGRAAPGGQGGARAGGQRGGGGGGGGRRGGGRRGGGR